MDRFTICVLWPIAQLTDQNDSTAFAETYAARSRLASIAQNFSLFASSLVAQWVLRSIAMGGHVFASDVANGQYECAFLRADTTSARSTALGKGNRADNKKRSRGRPARYAWFAIAQKERL